MTIEFEASVCSKIHDVWIIKPNMFEDERGILWSAFQITNFKEFLGFEFSVTHDKFATNKQGVLRGIHGDFFSWKLVSVPSGEVFQVYVDNRKSSPTYRQHKSITLNCSNKLMVLLPPGVGNAFLALKDDTLYNYKLCYQGEYIDEDGQFTLKWNDPALGIEWPKKALILSKRDR